MTVEISSVNRKQLEIVLSLGRELDSLEPRVRELIHQQVSRGRLLVKVLIDTSEDRSGTRVRFNTRLAEQYLKEAKRLSRELKLEQSLSIDSLLRVPGMVEIESALQDPEHVWKSLSRGLKQAVKQLNQTRDREGRHLAGDLKQRVRLLRKHAAHVRKQAPQVAKKYRAQLQQRIENAGIQLSPEDDERLLKELVIFADRSDISEELTRLESHFQQFDDCLKKGGPMGRQLDFLAQEMNREINTIGSKANDAGIAHEIVALKTELERFREQAQNVA